MEEYKGYYIKSAKQTPQHKIVVTTGRGGKIPDQLTGLFTSPSYAKAAIDSYLATKSKKEDSNGETVSKG